MGITLHKPNINETRMEILKHFIIFPCVKVYQEIYENKGNPFLIMISIARSNKAACHRKVCWLYANLAAVRSSLN